MSLHRCFLLSSVGALVGIIVLGYRLLNVTKTVTRGGDRHSPSSPKCPEDKFCELRLYPILRSSLAGPRPSPLRSGARSVCTGYSFSYGWCIFAGRLVILESGYDASRSEETGHRRRRGSAGRRRGLRRFRPLRLRGGVLLVVLSGRVRDAQARHGERCGGKVVRWLLRGRTPRRPDLRDRGAALLPGQLQLPHPGRAPRDSLR